MPIPRTLPAPTGTHVRITVQVALVAWSLNGLLTPPPGAPALACALAGLALTTTSSPRPGPATAPRPCATPTGTTWWAQP
ncbi:hypothetical protein [Streptomyces sp. NPDC002287]